MLFQMFIGCLMISVTTLIHAMFMILDSKYLDQTMAQMKAITQSTGALVISGFIVIMIAASALEIVICGGLSFGLDSVASWEEAIYFSTVTYSTLGYGDVTLDAPRRILASFQGVIGLILFGWTTALVISAVALVYYPKRSAAPS